jgi:hypothetical protein
MVCAAVSDCLRRFHVRQLTSASAERRRPGTFLRAVSGRSLQRCECRVGATATTDRMANRTYMRSQHGTVSRVNSLLLRRYSRRRSTTTAALDQPTAALSQSQRGDGQCFSAHDEITASKLPLRNGSRSAVALQAVTSGRFVFRRANRFVWDADGSTPTTVARVAVAMSQATRPPPQPTSMIIGPHR